MGFTLAHVVPWGRSFDEYVAMFALTPAELNLRLLGCGDGPASFNAEATREGCRITSVDPIYAFAANVLKRRIDETFPTVMEQLLKNRGDFVWTSIASVEELGRLRMAAMATFLADFEQSKRAGRYLAGALPWLPFGPGTFDLALSSHFLFLYSDHLSAEFHLQAIVEMLRVAAEARVFPLLTLAGAVSPHLPLVREGLAGQGYRVEVRRVGYEFQRGGNAMLVIRKA